MSRSYDVLGLSDVTAAVDEADLPDEVGVLCVDSPGGKLHDAVIVGALDDGRWRVYVAAEEPFGSRHIQAVTFLRSLDRETLRSEIETAGEIVFRRLRSAGATRN